MEKVCFIVDGRVQRVGFRRFVLRQAQAFHIAGWVRNNDDGTVQVMAAGNADELSLFIQACRKGPLFAHVTDLRFVDPQKEQADLFSPTHFKVIR